MTQLTIEQVMQLAIQNHQAGRYAEAEKIYRQILQQQPNHADALHLLGLIACRAGQLDAGIELFRRAIAINAADPASRNSLGIALKNKGELDEAISAYREALRLKPDYAEAHCNLGVAVQGKGEVSEAIAAYRHALRLNPHYAEAHNNLGISLYGEGHADEAIAAFRNAIRLKPGLADAHNNLGIALYKSGQVDQAVIAHRRAVELKPDYAEAHSNLANALRDTGEIDQAIAAARRAIELNPELAEAHHNLAMSRCDVGQLDSAIAASRHAVHLKPDSASLHSNLLLILHYSERSSAHMLRDETFGWASKHADALTQFVPPHTNDRSPNRRLKIGYVSADFRDHPVGRFFQPLLISHDPARVEVFCYSQLSSPDAFTQRIRSHAHQWREIQQLTDQQLAKQIRDDQIDILVDLAGHTGGNRLLVFARKPAPVQVTWLGYPNTTGVATMDYRMTDELADPLGLRDTLCREKLIRLPHVAWCYQGPQIDRPADKTADRPVTFGSFNNFSKITTPMLELWAEILRSTPHSRLLIKAKALACKGANQRVRQTMENAGVTSNRLELQSWRTSYEEHLAAYGKVDIALDTFPYHGTTTTCEALWMGVPVITLAGETHVSRVGVSLLTTVGLPELIAHSPEQYVQFVVELAKDTSRLRRLRSELRERMLVSPLMDASGFARDVEAAYRQMWHEWCA